MLVLAGTVFVAQTDDAAASCPAFNSASCNNICAYDSGTQVYVCDLTTNGDAQSALANAISGNCGTDQYCVFGTSAASANTSFCCSIGTANQIDGLILRGSSYDDELSFWYGAYDLDAYGTTDFDGKMYGADGNDIMEGSHSTNVYYKDNLLGESGQDEIDALDGKDYVNGGAHEDSIKGGPGDDTLEGDEGDDVIAGNSGNDQIKGGNGYDHISGGTGADLIFGDVDDDTICGDDDTDDLRGNDGDDTLWGAGTDTKTGGAHTNGDTCDSAGTNLTCESTFSPASRPAACPTP